MTKIWTKELLKTRAEVAKDFDNEIKERRPAFRKSLKKAIKMTLLRRIEEKPFNKFLSTLKGEK